MTWDKPFLQVFSTQDKQQEVKKQSKIQKSPRVYKDQYSHLLNPYWPVGLHSEASILAPRQIRFVEAKPGCIWKIA